MSIASDKAVENILTPEYGHFCRTLIKGSEVVVAQVFVHISVLPCFFLK